MFKDYICSVCGADAYYDGRCGDGPVLMCACAKEQFVDDRFGGYYVSRAKPIEKPRPAREPDPDDYWKNRR